MNFSFFSLSTSPHWTPSWLWDMRRGGRPGGRCRCYCQLMRAHWETMSAWGPGQSLLIITNYWLSIHPSIRLIHLSVKESSVWSLEGGFFLSQQEVVMLMSGLFLPAEPLSTRVQRPCTFLQTLVRLDFVSSVLASVLSTWDASIAVQQLYCNRCPQSDVSSLDLDTRVWPETFHPLKKMF